MKKLIALSCILLTTGALAQARNGGRNSGPGSNGPGANQGRDSRQGPGHQQPQRRRMVEKLLKTVTVDNKPDTEIIKVDSCEGRKNEKLDSLTLKFTDNDVKLKSVKVSYESILGGRSTRLQKLSVRSKTYREGEEVKIEIPGNQCIDTIAIDAKPEARQMGPNNRNSRPSRDQRNTRGQRHQAPSQTAKIKVFAKIEK